MKTPNTKHQGHAPGPWQALNGGPYVTTNCDPEGEHVICITANHVNQVCFAAPVASLIDAANARLIAAAPELLAMCEHAAGVIHAIQTGNVPAGLIPHIDSERLIRAAIAKAKGAV